MLLTVFVVIERRVAAPMFRLDLFKIRAFSGGNVATFLAALSRGGLMFMLILWLQGIWLPLHGYGFEDTPLWAGIYMLPLSAGFLIAGPISGRLADHFGARPFATGGMIVSAIGFLLLIALPINFTYWQFGLVIFLIGAAMGLFAAPNLTGIMNSLPPDQRGSARAWRPRSRTPRRCSRSGSSSASSSSGCPRRSRPSCYHGLASHGVPQAAATSVSKLPPVGSLFASFLGYNPVGTLLAPTLPHLPHATAAYLTGHKFFPTLVSHPFATGIHTVFYFAAGCCVVAAVASWMRGGNYYKADVAEVEEAELLEVA